MPLCCSELKFSHFAKKHFMDPLEPLLFACVVSRKNKIASFNSSSLGWRLLECHGSPFVPDPGVSSPPFPRCSLVQVQPHSFYFIAKEGEIPQPMSPWLLPPFPAAEPWPHGGLWKGAGRWRFTPFPSLSATNTFASAHFISKQHRVLSLRPEKYE